MSNFPWPGRVLFDEHLYRPYRLPFIPAGLVEYPIYRTTARFFLSGVHRG